MHEMQMPPNFTLRYDVTCQDVRTPQMRQFDSDFEGVVKGQLVAHSESLAKPVRNYVITVSALGNKLFTRKQEPKQANAKDIIDVYDGNDTLECYHGKHTSTGFLYPSLSAISRTYQAMVLPGASMPGIPLVEDSIVQEKSQNTMQLLGQSFFLFGSYNSTKMPYKTQIDLLCSREGKKVKDAIMFNPNGSTLGRWDCSKWTQISGVWIASDLTWTYYTDYRRGSPDTLPDTRLTYHLIQSSSTSVPASWFDFSTWFRDGDPMQDVRTSPSVGFWYSSKGGSFEQQIEHAQWDAQRRQAELDKGNFKGSARSGLFILFVLTIGIGIWLWRRKRMMGRN